MFALFLIGQMRTYNNIKIINSYEKYLFKDEKLDVYIFTWDKVGFSNNHGKTNYNDQMNDEINENDLVNFYKQFDFINVKHIYIENFDDFLNDLKPDLLKVYETPFRHHAKVSTFIPIQYKYQQAIQYFSQLEDNTKYSTVIITRPDIYFEKVPSFTTTKTEEDTIYWCRRFGADLCWYGTPQSIIKQLDDIFDRIIENRTIVYKHRGDSYCNNVLLQCQCEEKGLSTKTMLCDDYSLQVLHF